MLYKIGERRFRRAFEIMNIHAARQNNEPWPTPFYFTITSPFRRSHDAKRHFEYMYHRASPPLDRRGI